MLFESVSPGLIQNSPGRSAIPLELAQQIRTDLTRIEESALKAYKEAAKAGPLPCTAEPSASPDNFLKQIQPAPDFRHKWPDGSDEDFKNVQECLALYRGREHHVKFGFTIRKAAGKDRLRVLVLVDRYPTVEFVGEGAEMKGGKEQVASVIKDRKGKQLPIGAAIPPEYQGLQVGPYQDVGGGPNASNELAIISSRMTSRLWPSTRLSATSIARNGPDPRKDIAFLSVQKSIYDSVDWLLRLSTTEVSRVCASKSLNRAIFRLYPARSCSRLRKAVI